MRFVAIVVAGAMLGALMPAQEKAGEGEAKGEQTPPEGRLPDLAAGKLRPRGITPEIELAIQKGLRFLSQTQNRDGSWRSAGGYGSYPVAMSGLAGTALAASGSTTTRGPYCQNLRRCVEFLLRNTMDTGLITAIHEEARPMYGHGFATLFLAEMYGMEEEIKQQQKLHRVLKKAVELIASSQSAAGGWLYAPDDNGDEGSVTVTQVQALRACRNAGVSVPIKVIQSAVKYIADCQNPDGGIAYSARSRGSSRPPISAAAVAVLYNAGKYDDPMAEKALQYSLRTLPITGGSGHHYYAHFYLAQAMFQRVGKDWDDYFDKMAKWLLRQQAADGSWQGDGVGTTYGTALALVMLQLPYAYLPIYQR